MKAGEILRGAAELIGKPDAWMQAMYAADRLGRRVSADDKDAACWCISGAVVCIGGYGTPESKAARIALADAVGLMFAETWNDTPGRTQAECVAKLLEAAELADKTPS